MQSIVLALGDRYGSGKTQREYFSRRSCRYVRFIVINELLKFIESQFLISNLIFKRIFENLRNKRWYVGWKAFNLIESFLGTTRTTQTDKTFTTMAQAFSAPKKDRVEYRRLYNLFKKNNLFRYDWYWHHNIPEPEHPTKFLFSGLPPVQIYAKLIADLENSKSYYSSKKDNDYVLRIIDEVKKRSSFIFDFR